MIRRLLDRIATRIADTGWLRDMRYREVQATRSAMHAERRQRKGSESPQNFIEREWALNRGLDHDE